MLGILDISGMETGDLEYMYTRVYKKSQEDMGSRADDSMALGCVALSPHLNFQTLRFSKQDIF